MRIHQLARRSHDDSGAIAIIVALLSVVLVGMAAISVDLGLAWSAKRQLSVSADAAALAAARALNDELPVGTACNETTLTPIALAEATLANSQNDKNGGSTVESVVVRCSADDIQVDVVNRRAIDSVFGKILGVSNYNPAGRATAQLFVPAAAEGLRPIAACESTVTSNYQPSASPPVKNPFVVWVDKEDAVCGTAASGQWGFTNFLEQGSFGEFNQSGSAAYNPDPDCDPNPGNTSAGGNAGCQSEWTDLGYNGPVWFPNPAVGGDTGLGGNTGLANSNAWRDAFDGLVDEIITLPVADQYYEQSGVDRLNLKGVVAVKVCAAKRGNQLTTHSSTLSPECDLIPLPATPPASALEVQQWADMKNNEAGLWVVPVSYATSGVAGPRPGCITNPSGCDFGTRGYRLYK